MNNTYIIAIIAVLIVIGGALYFNYGYPEGEVMMEKGSDMMDEGTAMMEKGDDMMDEGAMMKKDGESMMEGDTMMKKDEGTMMEKAPEGTMMSAGSYEAYSPEKLSKAREGDVVLFFRASWCPTCRGLDANIRSNAENIPMGVTILDVDYDTSTALKQKYGVTYQHTLVQVDAEGNQIAKWTSSPNLASLVSNIK